MTAHALVELKKSWNNWRWKRLIWSVIMAEKWIQKAIKKPGALKKELGVPAGKTIPAKKLAAAAKKPGKIGQRARFAEVLKGFK